jgi:hypothetical protein
MDGLNFNKKPYASIDAEAGTPRFEKRDGLNVFCHLEARRPS